MDYKEILDQIKEYLSACECMRYGEYVGAPWPYNHDGPMVYTEPDAVLLDLAATAITDLLARAEAAEAKNADLLKARFGENASAKMVELVDEVNEIRNKKVEAEARAKKAERERDAAVEDLRQMCVGGNTCAFCKYGRNCGRQGSGRKTVEPCWEWRGQKEDQS